VTLLAVSCLPAAAQSRVALVIANSSYQSAPGLATTVADAGLIVETLKAARYDVVQANDVTKASIGQSIRAVLDKVAAAGPTATVFVYFAGYGAQLNNQNYLVPVDAQIANAEALATEALPLSALVDALASVPAAARILVLDAARDHGFGRAAGQLVAPGLAAVGAPPGTLIAYSAAPGAVVADGPGPYSPFATALTVQMRQPGLDIEKVFKNAQLQLGQASNGAQMPYVVSSLTSEVKLFDAPAAQPAPATPPVAVAPTAPAAPVAPAAPAAALVPAKCSHGQHWNGTRCAKVVCHHGLVPGDNGDCERRHKATVATAPGTDHHTQERTRARPTTGARVVCGDTGCRSVPPGCHGETRASGSDGTVAVVICDRR
jgi:hypothetical protein